MTTVDHRSTGIWLAMTCALVIGVSTIANAQVSVFTPALEGDYFSVVSACTVVNQDNVAQPVTIILRSANGGAIGAVSGFTIAPGATASVAREGGEFYCEAISNSAGAADQLLLALQIVDLSGKTVSALPGVRILSGSGPILFSPSLFVTSNNERVVCRVVNVGTSAQTVTVSLFNEVGATVATNTQGIAAGDSLSLSDVPSVGPGAVRYCKVAASSGTLARNLRASLYGIDNIGPDGPHGAVVLNRAN